MPELGPITLLVITDQITIIWQNKILDQIMITLYKKRDDPQSGQKVFPDQIVI